MTEIPIHHEIVDSFIVFEGLDGAGTTTQAKRLVEFLNRTKVPAEFTCEPTSFLTGITIRSLLNGPEHVEPDTMAYLFAADRNEHLNRPGTGIRALLGERKTVVCDRYLFSSLAYQGTTTGDTLVGFLNERFPLPRHLVFLDVSPEVAETRRSARGAGDIYENLAFQQEVFHAYKTVLDHFTGSGMEIHRINGNSDEDTVFGALLAALSLNNPELPERECR